MPGRTPSDAFSAFIDPIAEAVSCLGQAKVVPSPGGRSEPDKVHAWALNASSGMAFPGGWHFEAQMHYSLVQGAISREWKVKTLGYRYRLALLGTHLWRIHWHPTVTSGYDLPHVHLNFDAAAGEIPVETMGLHHPTGRMTFEDAVEWVLNMGITPARGDFADVLAATRGTHVEHRTWHTRPPA